MSETPEQPALFDLPAGDRGGATYSAPRDRDRLNRQARLVFQVMADGRWHTLAEISERTEQPEASVSARLRDLRKHRFGSHIINTRYRGSGLWEYRWEGRLTNA
jgi:hypothetical protein